MKGTTYFFYLMLFFILFFDVFKFCYTYIFKHKGFEVRINVWWRMICLDASRNSILVFVQQIKHFTSCSFSFLPFATWQDAFFLSDSFVLALRLIS